MSGSETHLGIWSTPPCAPCVANDPAEAILRDDQSDFVSSIPEHYDRNLGPIIFTDYAADIARRAAAGKPAKVLETAAGTGIVTRALRDHLPAGTRLTATDLNEPMLDVARTKFRAGEQVEFQPADALALPFADGSFDTVVCQFGVMFFPDKDQSYREVYRVLTPGGRYLFNIWDSHRYKRGRQDRSRNRQQPFPDRSAAIHARAVLVFLRARQGIAARRRLYRHHRRRGPAREGFAEA